MVQVTVAPVMVASTVAAAASREPQLARWKGQLWVAAAWAAVAQGVAPQAVAGSAAMAVAAVVLQARQLARLEGTLAWTEAGAVA